MIADIKIEQDKFSPHHHRLLIDGVDFGNSACGVCIEANEIPKVFVQFESTPDFEGKGIVEIDYDTVKLAVKILRYELMKHGDLYNTFIASINSAIDDMIRNKCDSKTEPAEYILQRIIGEDET